VPQKLDQYVFKYEPAPSSVYRKAAADLVVRDGRVYSFSAQGATDGALEISVFKPNVDVSDINDESMIQHCAETPVDCQGHEVLKGLQDNIGNQEFQRLYYRNYERAYVMVLPDQRIYLWFPPRTESMVLLIVLGQLGPVASDAIFHAVMDFQHHQVTTEPLPVPSIAPASPAPLPNYGPGQSPSPSPGAATLSPSPGGRP
jgi:hypothetical protein